MLCPVAATSHSCCSQKPDPLSWAYSFLLQFTSSHHQLVAHLGTHNHNDNTTLHQFTQNHLSPPPPSCSHTRSQHPLSSHQHLPPSCLLSPLITLHSSSPHFPTFAPHSTSFPQPIIPLGSLLLLLLSTLHQMFSDLQGITLLLLPLRSRQPPCLHA